MPKSFAVGSAVVLSRDFADMIEASESDRLTIWEVVDSRGVGAEPLLTIAPVLAWGVDGARAREVFDSEIVCAGRAAAGVAA